MKNKQFFILILFLVIGFASISATLVINGNMKVAANLDDFNVIFIEGFLNGETNEDVIISGDKKTLTFTTNKLTNINDTARIDYKVKNTSTQYDGDVTVNCTTEANEYVNVTSSFDGKTLPLTDSINMQAQEVKSGHINAELIKATTEDQEIKVTCKIEVNATSRTNYAYSLSFDSNGGTNVEDKVVEYNTSYGELSVPKKEGYTFIGWFDENDVRVDQTTILDTKGNKTLTAKWASIAYPVEMKKVYKDKTETSMINIPYGESVDALITIDDKYFIDNVECTNGYSIDNFDKAIYEKATIKINNNNSPKTSTCTLTMLQGVYDFSYIGSEQLFEVPYDGSYKIELWGACGGNSHDAQGTGGYTSGIINLIEKDNLFVYVGNKGDNKRTAIYNGGGYGGTSGGSPGYSGGGATDIRLVGGLWSNFDSLKSRIMVAAGGGGRGTDLYNTAGENSIAGGLVGYKGGYFSGHEYQGQNASGGTQTSGGLKGNNIYGATGATYNGSFGIGAKNDSESSTIGAGGGGSGYYGGGSGGGTKGSGGGNGGGGGSSFISGHNGCNAVSKDSTSSKIVHTGQSNHYSGYVFTNTIMIDGAGYKWTNVKGEYTGMPSYDGRDTMPGNNNTGYAKITFLG